MTSRQLDEERIFHVAREIGNPAARDDYLDQICAGDQALRERVEALLEVHEKEQHFLKSSPEPAPTVDHTALAERPGTTIGRYKLMEQIGEGGMGTVFVAEQERPIRRKVALKVIKPGMDSRAVVARFEAERQALAMMDHPNIAKVLDAGTTDSGRPYFAMELVKGIPITEYCDKNKLTIRERLDQFIQVCQAIQHAHQKGIIHRDIKPSNVLVTLHDGKPVPKVIDFGVAKALNQKLTDKTIYTRVHQAVGTLAYMSPEQAELSGLDVDTRADVYGLGVLLYELLTSTTPFEQRRLHEAAYQEACRIIRDEEPPRPSIKISSLGETATAISSQRKSDPVRLGAMFRGELDWIAMKALEKDRTRRYETANQFAEDIQRHLSAEPIQARPPTPGYRIRKFVQRNRGLAWGATALLITLLVGIAGTTGAWLIAVKKERETTRVLAELHDQLSEKVILCSLSGDRAETEEALVLARRASVHSETLALLEGIAAYHFGENRRATELLDDVLEKDPNNTLAHAMLALTEVHMGNWNEYVGRMTQIEAALAEREFKDHERLLLAYALFYLKRQKSEKILQETVKQHPTWVFPRALLGGMKAHRALELPDAAHLVDDALKETGLAYDLLPDNPVVIMYHFFAHNAAIYLATQNSEPVDELRQEATALATKLEADFPHYEPGALNCALFYEHNGDMQRALTAMSEAIGDADHGGWTYVYAAMLVQNGQSAVAVDMLETIQPTSTHARLALAYLEMLWL